MDKSSELGDIITSLNTTINNTSDITNDLSDITYNVHLGKEY